MAYYSSKFPDDDEFVCDSMHYDNMLEAAIEHANLTGYDGMPGTVFEMRSEDEKRTVRKFIVRAPVEEVE